MSNPPSPDGGGDTVQSIQSARSLSSDTDQNNTLTIGDAEDGKARKRLENVRFRHEDAATETITSRATINSLTSTAVMRPLRHNVDHLKKTRLLEKNGQWNINYLHSGKKRSVAFDMFTTVVEAQWRYTLLVFGMAFIITWLVFAVIWYVIAVAHGDLDNLDNADWIPCVNHIENFTSAFLFSLETQHTIGYGYRYINEECAEGVIMLILQSVGGVLIQCIVAGLVFAKFARAKRRADTLKFSREAVICLRDSKLCLMYQVGDIRKTHRLSTQVKAQFIQKKITDEGEIIPLHQTDVKVGLETGDESIFMIWPVTLVHWIDSDSPFYEMNADSLQQLHFELIVTIDGAAQSNGMAIQARSSYLPTEIVWGHRFKRMVAWNDTLGMYTIDHNKFHTTVEVPCPRLSAKEIEDVGGLINVVPQNKPTDPLSIFPKILADLGPTSSSPNTDRKSKKICLHTSM